MSAFRSDGQSRVARGLLAAWLVLAPAAAFAEDLSQAPGPPISLLPPPAPGAAPSVSGEDEPVASEPLAAPVLGWSAGTAPRDALPPEFWRGTSREMAELLLERLPDTTSSALQALERRLLLSPAAAPEGPDAVGLYLPALRASALLRLGEIDATRAVIAAIPQSDRRPALPFAVAADAIAGEVERACATVREAVRRDQDAFWQTALVACQALQGETEQASLGLQILDEEHAADDAALAAGVGALAGQHAPPTISQADGIDPLTLRLLVRAKRSLAPDVVDALPPHLALCLAFDEDAPASARLPAAERAALLGALPADQLRARYRASPEAGQARRFTAILEAASAEERLHRIAGFADAFGGPQKVGFSLAARLVSPILREIEPDPSLAGSAPSAARLLIAAGEIPAAARWAALAIGKERGSLRMLLALATGRAEHSPNSAETTLPPLAVALSTALGEPPDSGEWAALPTAAWTGAGPSSPPPAAWLDLAEAARAKRIGEAALAAILVASPAGTLTTDPVSLFAAVSGLREVGLEADARRLAIESALAAGL
jgi:hypothetical protein